MNQWAIIWSARASFLSGFIATLELFIIAAVSGMIIGTAVLYFTELQYRTVNRVIHYLVSLMRAVPFLILAYLLYYGLPEIETNNVSIRIYWFSFFIIIAQIPFTRPIADTFKLPLCYLLNLTIRVNPLK